jgi:hypothetical protein
MLSSLTLNHVVITLTIGHKELRRRAWRRVYKGRSIVGVMVRVRVGVGWSDAAAPGSRVEGAANWAAKLIFLKKNLIFCAQRILNYWAE